MQNRLRDELLGAAGAAGLSLLVLVSATGFASESLGTPLRYAGDELHMLSWIQGFLDHGVWGLNPSLGAPEGQPHFDFPSPGLALLHLVVVRILGTLLPDTFAVANAFLLLGFASVAASAYLFLRFAGLSRSASTVASVLYAFLPYHTLRASEHLLLSGYHGVPVALGVSLWLIRGAPASLMSRARARALFPVLVLLMAATEGYYAWLSLWTILIGSLVGAHRHRSPAPLAAGLALMVAIAGVVAAECLPLVLHRRDHGANPEAMRRIHAESETYGLKLANLVLPVPEHRHPRLAELSDLYSLAPLATENRLAGLGIVGSLGALLLLATCIAGSRPDRESSVPGHPLLLAHELSPLFLGLFMIGTVGGLGSLSEFFLPLGFRATNRVSVALALPCLGLAIAHLDHLLAGTRGPAGQLRRRLALLTMAIFGLWDMLPREALRRDPLRTAVFRQDREDLAALGAGIATGTTIFQIPHVAFPSSPSIHQLGPFDSLRPYLHLPHLRYSAGAMRGRPAESRMRFLASLPIAEARPLLAQEGYRGLLLSRMAFPDAGFGIVDAWRAELGAEPREHGPWVLFDLPPNPAVPREGDLPIRAALGAGSSPVPGAAGPLQGDLDGCGQLWLHVSNPNPVARPARIGLSLSHPGDHPSPEVRIAASSLGPARALPVGRGNEPLRTWTDLLLPPGILDLRLDAGNLPVVRLPLEQGLVPIRVLVSGISVQEVDPSPQVLSLDGP